MPTLPNTLNPYRLPSLSLKNPTMFPLYSMFLFAMSNYLFYYPQVCVLNFMCDIQQKSPNKPYIYISCFFETLSGSLNSIFVYLFHLYFLIVILLAVLRLTTTNLYTLALRPANSVLLSR
jgi:hypothetical protein